MNAAFSYASLVRSDSNKTRGRESAGCSRFPGTHQAAPLNNQCPHFPFWSAVRPQLKSRGTPFREFSFLLLLRGLTG